MLRGTIQTGFLQAPSPDEAGGGGPSDLDLVARARQGEREAFTVLVERYRPRVHAMINNMVRNDADAWDLTQETFLKAWLALGRFEARASFFTWLYRIAHNRLNDHWRAAKHRPPPPSDADERTARMPDPHTPERILSDFEQRRRLQRAMDELPEEQREVLVRRLERELSLEEIAEITGVGRETVKSRLRYAMDKLRARLAP